MFNLRSQAIIQAGANELARHPDHPREHIASLIKTLSEAGGFSTVYPGYQDGLFISSERIGDMIRAIQKEMRTVICSMEEGLRGTDQGVAEATAQSFAQLATLATGLERVVGGFRV